MGNTASTTSTSAIYSDYNAFTPVIKVDPNRPVTEEIASFSTDLNMFQGWLPLTDNLDEVLNGEAGGDITVYDRIGRDPRVAANRRTRSKAVVGREWEMIPYSQEKIDLEVSDYVKRVLQNFPYDRARRSLLRGGVLKGYSVGEVMWDYSEGDTFISDILYRHQRRFRFAPNSDLHLLTLGNPYPGINATRDPETGLLLKKFQTFAFGDEVVSPYGNGLGQELYWPWFFKRNGIKFWLIFIEKFAAPFVGRRRHPLELRHRLSPGHEPAAHRGRAHRLHHLLQGAVRIHERRDDHLHSRPARHHHGYAGQDGEQSGAGGGLPRLHQG